MESFAKTSDIWEAQPDQEYCTERPSIAVARPTFRVGGRDQSVRHGQELTKRLAEGQAVIEASYYCPHHRYGAVLAYTENCEWRKPKPGLLRRASENLGLSLVGSYMVGDNLTDLQAGQAAGAKGVIVGDNRAHCPGWAVAADDLLEAAGLILADHLESVNSTPEWRELPCSP